MRINPLNESLCDKWELEEKLDPLVGENVVTNKIFKIEPNNYMLVSFDLRHLLDQEQNWVYGEDWDISFMISDEEFSINATAHSVLLSEQFLNSKTSKSQLLEFSVLAWKDIYVRIDILIYNALYTNHKYQFLNSTSVEIRTPTRAVMGTQMVFVASLPEEYLISLPFNQPPIQIDAR